MFRTMWINLICISTIYLARLNDWKHLYAKYLKIYEFSIYLRYSIRLIEHWSTSFFSNLIIINCNNDLFNWYWIILKVKVSFAIMSIASASRFRDGAYNFNTTSCNTCALGAREHWVVARKKLLSLFSLVTPNPAWFADGDLLYRNLVKRNFLPES